MSSDGFKKTEMKGEERQAVTTDGVKLVDGKKNPLVTDLSSFSAAVKKNCRKV